VARGSYHISLDAKGRMAIPTKLRDALCGDTGGAVVVTISASDRCLLLYRLADWEQVEQKLIALPALNQQARQLKRMLLGHAEDCVMDGSGRILLSQQIREYANLDRKAVLVGQGDKYEIWGLTMASSEAHIPVLLREAVDALNIREGGVYVDATFGRGGHARNIANSLGKQGKLIGFDRDPRAIELGRKLFANDERVQLLHSEFSLMAKALKEFVNIEKVDGVLMDLGVSSPQLDQAERGFSFMRDGLLDMRMDTTQGESAAQWLSRVEEQDLVKVLFELGEEKFARRIARAIVLERNETKIDSTLQLASLIENSIPKKDKHKHPATRTFQAIRLHVNQELMQINQALPQAVSLLNEGGRLAVISFHSLEDRIVKRFIRGLSTPNLPPKNIPVSEDAYRTPLKAISRAIKPSKQEVLDNPRSRSSVLRIAERTDVAYCPPSQSAGGYCA